MRESRTRRLFYALWPDDGVRRALAAWQRAHLPGNARPTHVADLHLTLHFLGQVEESGLDALQGLGSRLILPPFDMTLDHLGCWPRPAVLWVGPQEVPAPLAGFHAQLEEDLGALGFERDSREYRPHVTLARKVRRVPDGVVWEPVRWAVREWALVESITGERPLYHPLARWRTPP